MSGGSGREAPSGGAPVGLLCDLAPLERAVILHLRRWCSGGAAAAQAVAQFADRLGPQDGLRLARHLDRFLLHCLGRSRRPLRCHAVDCPCLGADESMLARQVALAAAGDSDAALRIALDYLPDAAAWQAVIFAEDLGLALHGLIQDREAWAALFRPSPFPPAPERTT